MRSVWVDLRLLRFGGGDADAETARRLKLLLLLLATTRTPASEDAGDAGDAEVVSSSFSMSSMLLFRCD